MNKKEEKGLAMNVISKINLPDVISNTPMMKPSILWHQRLGHATLAKISKIEGLKDFEKGCTDVCLTCPTTI